VDNFKKLTFLIVNPNYRELVLLKLSCVAGR